MPLQTSLPNNIRSVHGNGLAVYIQSDGQAYVLDSNGKTALLSDYINFPVAETPTLQAVTDEGSTTDNGISIINDDPTYYLATNVGASIGSYFGTDGSMGAWTGDQALDIYTSTILGRKARISFTDENGFSTILSHIVTGANKQIDLPDASGTLLIGKETVNNLFVGSTAGANIVIDGGNTGVGVGALESSNAINNTGLGFEALKFNSGQRSSGAGLWALKVNTGNDASGFGQEALQFNMGNRSSGFGVESLQANIGDNVTGIGYNALIYNEGDNNTAIGSDSFLFVPNVAGLKSFLTTDVNTALNEITIAAHGFGPDGTYRNLLYEGVSGGIQNNTTYPFLIIDANTIQLLEDSVHNLDGTEEGNLTPQIVYTNTTTIGYNAQPSASNQIVLGNGNVTSVVTVATITAAGLTFNSPNPNIIGNDADGTLSVVASTASGSGSEIRLYGESHATKANDFEILSDNAPVVNWDNSANTLNINGSVEANSYRLEGSPVIQTIFGNILQFGDINENGFSTKVIGFENTSSITLNENNIVYSADENKIGGEVSLTQSLSDTGATNYEILARNTSSGVIERIPNKFPYKVYTALMAQSGTNAPTAAVILENTLGNTPIWSRVSAGTYRLTSTSFAAGKTFVLCMNSGLDLGSLRGQLQLPNTIQFIHVLDDGSGLTDNIDMASIEVRVYN